MCQRPEILCVCVHGMPCHLEIKGNDRLKREHVESCPSAIKNIIFPLSKYLWPPNLTGR